MDVGRTRQICQKQRERKDFIGRIQKQKVSLVGKIIQRKGVALNPRLQDFLMAIASFLLVLALILFINF